MPDKKPFKVLVVCTGNICRSPVAEAIIKKKLLDIGISEESIYVTSAGVAAPLGVRPDNLALRVAARAGYTISPEKRSEQISLAQLRESDLILVMELGHKHYVRDRYAPALTKTFLLGQWNGGEIPDPVGRDEDFFSRIMAELDVASESWIPRIREFV